MLDDLEQRLTTEIKSITDGNQSLTNKTLDLQAQQDEVAQMQAGRDQGRSRRWKPSTSSWRRPPNPDHRRCRRPSHQGRKEAVDDDRDDHLRLVLRRPVRDRFPRIANPEGGFRRRSPHRPGPPGGRHLADPAVQSHSRRDRRAGGIESDRYWQNLLLESIDATRTMLVHAARTGSHRVVMITSAVGGEGKTSLASHLATSLARSGLQTLLIDADLRSPSIHRLFDLPVAAGLSEVLRGEVEWRRCDRGHRHRRPESPHRGAMRSADHSPPLTGWPWSALRPAQRAIRFRDRRLSPILPVADGLIIAQQADAVLFSIFRDVSQQDQGLGRVRTPPVPGRADPRGRRDGGSRRPVWNDYYDQDSPYLLLPESAADSSDPST